MSDRSGDMSNRGCSRYMSDRSGDMSKRSRDMTNSGRNSRNMGKWVSKNRSWEVLINMGTRSKDQRISIRISNCFSISFSICITLCNVVIPIGRLITESFHYFLANLLVLNLFSFDSFSFTNIFSGWNTSLGGEHLMFCLAVWGRDCVLIPNSMVVGISLGVSICNCFSFSLCGRGFSRDSKKIGNSKYLYHVEIVRYFPRWLVE